MTNDWNDKCIKMTNDSNLQLTQIDQCFKLSNDSNLQMKIYSKLQMAWNDNLHEIMNGSKLQMTESDKCLTMTNDTKWEWVLRWMKYYSKVKMTNE